MIVRRQPLADDRNPMTGRRCKCANAKGTVKAPVNTHAQGGITGGTTGTGPTKNRRETASVHS